MVAILTSTAALVAVGGVVGASAGAPKTGSSATTAARTLRNAGTVTLTFGSYSVTKDVYEKEIFPAFQKYWKAKTGQTVIFQDSYDASGAESKAIASGLPVDVAALSLEADIDRIAKAGLITHNWKNDAYGGMVTDSVVALAVRKGNPLHIKDWTDLTKPRVRVLIPNPTTSGGAKWDINAIYGAGLQGSTPAHAKSLLAAVFKNVTIMDRSGEASMTTFTKGIGDVAVNYENTILEASNHLKNFDEVVPASTILIENPVAVVDKNVDKDGNRKVAEAFVNFLRTPQAQTLYAEAGFRPVNKAAWNAVKKNFVQPPKLFTINFLGGWTKVNNDLYSTNGIMNQVLEGK